MRALCDWAKANGWWVLLYISPDPSERRTPMNDTTVTRIPDMLVLRDAITTEHYRVSFHGGLAGLDQAADALLAMAHGGAL